MKQHISIGNQGFDSIREENSFYIDKTYFIKEWWESRSCVMLVTRPRRFGKTLNMSMIHRCRILILSALTVRVDMADMM